MAAKWVLATVLVVAACGATPESGGGDGAGGDDGELVASVSPFDTDVAAIRNLDPDLLHAVQDAATDARTRGVDIRVTSGWRSKAYQQRLLTQAIMKYGSLAEARKYVNTPDRSTHVTGRAVDIGPTDAADWMIQHGSDYGLCQIYANEMWHFELATTPDGDCPQPLSDAAG